MRNHLIYIKDIVEAMNKIEEFISGMSFEEFLNDDKTKSAVIRKFEVLGEATKNVSDIIRNNYSQVPWKEMAGMRDKLIHSYFGIDYELVWITIKKKIPEVKSMIQKILEELED